MIDPIGRPIAMLPDIKVNSPRKNKGPSSMDCRERGSYERGVYPTQDTSRMETAKGRSRHQNNSKRLVRNSEGKNVSTKGKSFKESLAIELTEGRESP